MTIHFVCSGNTFRSRLAETYLNSKRLKNIKVISSGVDASENVNRPISWLTQRLFETNKLVPFEKPNWTQTSKQLLDSADLTIFFDKKYYKYCVKQFRFHPNLFEIWDIEDLDKNIEDHLEKIRASEEIFNVIRQRVDNLVERKRF